MPAVGLRGRGGSHDASAGLYITMQNRCRYCGVVITGYGDKFCSLACVYASQRGHRKPHPPNAVCAWCGGEFYRRLNALSRSGLRFCCRAHKDMAQRLGGLKAVQPDHYGAGRAYRARVLATHGRRCKRCGYEKVPGIVEVHHINGDHNDNRPENMEPLCPNCHAEAHFKAKTGKWTRVRGRPGGSIPASSMVARGIIGQ